MARPSAVAERHQQILEATCLVISERGFRALRSADVATIAGYSTGTVHYYFASKDELLAEAFRFQYEKSVARREIYFTEGDDPVQRLRKLASGYLPSSEATIQSWRVWLELWVSAVRERPLAAINDVYYGDWRRAVLDAATSAKDGGLLNIADAVAFADAYTAMLDGLAIQVLVGSSHMTAERMQATCASFLDAFLVR